MKKIFLTLSLIFGILFIGGCDMEEEAQSLSVEEEQNNKKKEIIVSNIGEKKMFFHLSEDPYETTFEYDMFINVNDSFKLNVNPNRYFLSYKCEGDSIYDESKFHQISFDNYNYLEFSSNENIRGFTIRNLELQ